LLNNHGLSNLTSKFFKQNKPDKFIEALTEINFTSQLLSSLPSNKLGFKIEFEPQHIGKKIDLEIEYNNKNYKIQIKYLSPSIKENMQTKICDEIKRQSQKVEVNRGVNLKISANFQKNQVKDLIKFIEDNLWRSANEWFSFPGQHNSDVQIQFKTSLNNLKNYLVVYSCEDMNIENVTGMIREQIRKSLLNAVKSFKSCSSDKEINLIVSEIGNNRDEAIDFAEALYGTVGHVIRNGQMLNVRGTDGLFNDEEFSEKKVAGVIVIHRVRSTLASNYEKIICINPSYEYITSITELVHDRVIDHNTWLEEGFFR
jgi:hypothetical protein